MSDCCIGEVFYFVVFVEVVVCLCEEGVVVGEVVEFFGEFVEVV